MKNLFLYSNLIILLACGKTEDNFCKHENTLVQIKHYDAFFCPSNELQLLIKSEKELEDLIRNYKCFSSSDFFEPADYNKSWIIGNSSKINFEKYKIEPKLYIDSCSRVIEYRYTLIQDTNSRMLTINIAPVFRYSIVSAVDLSIWKIKFSKEVINTHF